MKTGTITDDVYWQVRDMGASLQGAEQFDGLFTLTIEVVQGAESF